MQQNVPSTRLFFLDPFGSSDPNDLKNFGLDTIEHNYIFMHDQEPINLALHRRLYDEVINRNRDLNNWQGPGKSMVIVSEKNSDNLDIVCGAHGWQPFYYFFHGWAALDWYRGYDKTFLIPAVTERRPQHTFLSPNRIIAGQRKHRLQLLYWIFKYNLAHNHISCPEICPAEKIHVLDAVGSLPYQDCDQVFRSVQLPIEFAKETGHPMHSCWLSLFDEAADSLLYLVTETVAAGTRLHLTEKTFKPIALGMPFILIATAGSLEYLRSYGFKTFHALWDESYDLETNDDLRIEKVAHLLRGLDQLSISQRQDLLMQAAPVIEHNREHFYQGGFERVLWQEFTNMLHAIKSHC